MEKSEMLDILGVEAEMDLYSIKFNLNEMNMLHILLREEIRNIQEEELNLDPETVSHTVRLLSDILSKIINSIREKEQQDRN